MIDHDEYKEVLEALESGFIEIIDIEQHRKATCEALEKQIPKKINRKYVSKNGISLGYSARQCPNCKADFYYTDLGQTMYCDFCPDCGQALDWSSENE